MIRVRKSAALFVVALLALAVAGPGLAQAKKQKRYVALTPFAANTLVKLGIKPVAVGEGAGGNSGLNPKLKGVKKLQLSHASNGPNLEQLVSVNPDVVFSEKTWKAGHDAIRDLGIRVYMDDPISVAKVPSSIRKIGGDVKEKKKAQKVAKQATKQIQQSTQGIPAVKPKVLMILGVGQTPYAFLGNSWGGNLIERAGGLLATAGLDSDDANLPFEGGYAQISDEQIIAENPQVIIAVPHGNAEDIPAIKESLENDTAFAATDAGENDRIYVTTENTLVQASTEVAKTIKKVRRDFLLNR